MTELCTFLILFSFFLGCSLTQTCSWQALWDSLRKGYTILTYDQSQSSDDHHEDNDHRSHQHFTHCRSREKNREAFRLTKTNTFRILIYFWAKEKWMECIRISEQVTRLKWTLWPMDQTLVSVMYGWLGSPHKHSCKVHTEICKLKLIIEPVISLLLQTAVIRRF